MLLWAWDMWKREEENNGAIFIDAKIIVPIIRIMANI